MMPPGLVHEGVRLTPSPVANTKNIVLYIVILASHSPFSRPSIVVRRLQHHQIFVCRFTTIFTSTSSLSFNLHRLHCFYFHFQTSSSFTNACSSSFLRCLSNSTASHALRSIICCYFKHLIPCHFISSLRISSSSGKVFSTYIG